MPAKDDSLPVLPFNVALILLSSMSDARAIISSHESSCKHLLPSAFCSHLTSRQAILAPIAGPKVNVTVFSPFSPQLSSPIPHIHT